MTKEFKNIKTVLLALLLIGIAVMTASVPTQVSTYDIRAREKNIVIQRNYFAIKRNVIINGVI
ncbi:MAG: hypothetical protein WA144_04165 [Candidatus Methanoperedens sp.]